MLCTLAVHITPEGIYALQVSGRTALGPSGTGGRDVKHYQSADALLSDLDALGLSQAAAAAAVSTLEEPEARNRFIKIAEDVQIPFDILEQADVYLFD